MHSRDESPGRERDRYNTAFSEQNEPVAGEQQCPHCTIGITMCQLLCAHKRITCIIKKKINGMHLVPPNVLFFFFTCLCAHGSKSHPSKLPCSVEPHSLLYPCILSVFVCVRVQTTCTRSHECYYN